MRVKMINSTMRITAFSILLFLFGTVEADKDDSYYILGTGNPNTNEKMYWKDAENILQDLSEFSSLYVEFHHCAWTWMQMEEADNDVDENDYWYMGKVPPMGANVAYSLYGSLNGQSFGGCNKNTFINSFYTSSGFQNFAKVMAYEGVNGFSRFSYDDDDGSSGGLTAKCMGGYGVGCDYSNGFALHKYGSSECDPSNMTGVIDKMYYLNKAMKNANCVKIYDYKYYSGNDDDDVSDTPLSLLQNSHACFYQDYFSPDGECPDPYGVLSYYQGRFHEGIQESNIARDPYKFYRARKQYLEEIKRGKLMTFSGSLLLMIAAFVYAMGRRGRNNDSLPQISTVPNKKIVDKRRMNAPRHTAHREDDIEAPQLYVNADDTTVSSGDVTPTHHNDVIDSDYVPVEDDNVPEVNYARDQYVDFSVPLKAASLECRETKSPRVRSVRTKDQRDNRRFPTPRTAYSAENIVGSKSYDKHTPRAAYSMDHFVDMGEYDGYDSDEIDLPFNAEEDILRSRTLDSEPTREEIEDRDTGDEKSHDSPHEDAIIIENKSSAVDNMQILSDDPHRFSFYTSFSATESHDAEEVIPEHGAHLIESTTSLGKVSEGKSEQELSESDDDIYIEDDHKETVDNRSKKELPASERTKSTEKNEKDTVERRTGEEELDASKQVDSTKINKDAIVATVDKHSASFQKDDKDKIPTTSPIDNEAESDSPRVNLIEKNEEYTIGRETSKEQIDESKEVDSSKDKKDANVAAVENPSVISQQENKDAMPRTSRINDKVESDLERVRSTEKNEGTNGRETSKELDKSKEVDSTKDKKDAIVAAVNISSLSSQQDYKDTMPTTSPVDEQTESESQRGNLTETNEEDIIGRERSEENLDVPKKVDSAKYNEDAIVATVENNSVTSQQDDKHTIPSTSRIDVDAKSELERVESTEKNDEDRIGRGTSEEELDVSKKVDSTESSNDDVVVTAFEEWMGPFQNDDQDAVPMTSSFDGEAESVSEILANMGIDKDLSPIVQKDQSDEISPAVAMDSTRLNSNTKEEEAGTEAKGPFKSEENDNEEMEIVFVRSEGEEERGIPTEKEDKKENAISAAETEAEAEARAERESTLSEILMLAADLSDTFKLAAARGGNEDTRATETTDPEQRQSDSNNES